MRRLFVLACIGCVMITLQAKPVYGIRVNAGTCSNRCQTNEVSSGNEACTASKNIDNYYFI